MNEETITQIIDLEPKNLWKLFHLVCQVPRPSKHEEKIIQFVKEFGENLGLETIVEDVGNVIIRKPASPGMENLKTVTLQGHFDMVPQKTKQSSHDFEKDPIETHIDGHWVKAKDTTLGADNGIGLAAILAVLESKDIQHGPIEALFTVDEETSLKGAFSLKPDVLKGDILLNLDSEVDGIFFIGCAGGVSTCVSYSYPQEKTPDNMSAFEIIVSGLKGGHSGVDIHLERGNANKILSRVLWQANEKHTLRLANFKGGSLHNAIPRDASAIVTINNESSEKLVSFISEFEKTIKKEFVMSDKNLKIDIQPTDLPPFVMDKESQRKFLNAVYACPNDVMKMSIEMPGLVETSTNLAAIDMNNSEIEIITLQRSSLDSSKEYVSNMIRCLFELIGAKVVTELDYPGWNPNPNSEIATLIKEIYLNKFGKEPELMALHAGLECGLFVKTYPNMDIISFGPTIRNPHSPDEQLDIHTVSKFWDLLVETLKNIPEKN